MNLYTLNALEESRYRQLLTRGGADDGATLRAAAEICDAVRAHGDRALLEYTRRFDGVAPASIVVDADDTAHALASITREARAALRAAAGNIERFHAAQRVVEEPVDVAPGVRCWRERRAIDAVGLYVPAGSAPLPSTVLMLGIPAGLAGCRRVALVSPPDPSGRVDRHVLAAAAIAGIDEVYCVGGAQAIAALAFGTESIPRVEKIFGPGNRYVAAAKRHVAAQGVAVDLVAGPSELLVIADESADPVALAADLLAQAEHDADARVSLVTTSHALARSTIDEIDRQLGTRARASTISAALAGSFALVVESLDEAVAFSNAYAPEHLQINVVDPASVARSITAAGSVFLGPWSPVAAGDYASGTNHTLPTGGAARASSGLSLEAFQTTISFQQLTREGLESLAPTLVELATLEGLDAHARSVVTRFRTLIEPVPAEEMPS